MKSQIKNNPKQSQTIFAFLAMIFIGYGIYLYCSYEIETNFMMPYIIIAYILFCIWIIFSPTKLVKTPTKETKNGKFYHKLSLVKYIIALFLLPLALGFCLSFFISFHYTALFGKDSEYIAYVYHKEIHSSRRNTHYYVTITTDNMTKEELKDKELYNRVNIGSTLLIKQKKSFLGSYINYNDIRVTAI